jgi:ssDNA-specific exonuclease RecJ
MEFLGLNSSIGYNEETIFFMIQIRCRCLYMEFLGLNSNLGYNEETIVFMIQIQM